MTAYAGSKGQTGLASVLSIGGPTGGTDVFVAVGELTDIPFKRAPWKTTDTTNLDSSIEEAKPTIPGLTNVALKGNRVQNDAGQVLVETAYEAGVAYDFKLTLPKNASAGQTTLGDVFTWSAYVLSSDFDVAPTKIIQFDVSLQLNTRPVFVVGT